MKIYKYPTKKKWRPPIVHRRPTFAKDAEQLAGSFRGMKASDIEERFGNALQKSGRVRNVFFRVPVGAPRGMPGWKELDFLVETYYGYRAFQTDDVEFVHVGSRDKDRLTDMIILEELRKMGTKVNVIERIPSTRLGNGIQAKNTVRELLG